MIQPTITQPRNTPCYCGSGLKYKHCHGDAVKQEECNRVANKRMVELIADTIFSKEKSNGNGQ